jgi:hypothetical protein
VSAPKEVPIENIKEFAEILFRAVGGVVLSKVSPRNLTNSTNCRGLLSIYGLWYGENTP